MFVANGPRFGHAQQHIGDGIPGLLPRIPGLQHCGDFVQPWHFHRAAGLQHDHASWVGGGDSGDQRILVAGQGDVGQVRAFGIPTGIAPDTENRYLGGAGERNSGVNLGLS